MPTLASSARFFSRPDPFAVCTLSLHDALPILRPLLRRDLALGGSGPAGHPGLARGDAAARAREALRGPGAVRAAHVLPLPQRDRGGGGEPRAGGAHPEAPTPAPRTPPPVRDRPAGS